MDLEKLEKKREECLFFLNQIEMKYDIREKWTARDELIYNTTLLNLEAIEIKIDQIKQNL
jgi:hypothetical protein